MAYPITRLRRLRSSSTMRALLSETQLSPAQFIYPLFAVHGHAVRQPISAMPDVFHCSPDTLAQEAKQTYDLGIPAVLLFGLPASKDAIGKENFAADGIVQQAIQAVKAAAPNLLVITDVCMCEYTDHGHCGIVRAGQVINDETLAIMAQVAVSHAQAGADIVAPSSMMDGVVAAIRAGLDAANFQQTSILAYAVKFASAFYGPFREAAQSAPQFGDRHSYQMNPANRREALREAQLDEAEGADMLMVKPALPYLDILQQVRQQTLLPLAAYHVSGEYSMIKAAAANGWIDERRVALETLLGIRRAGADMIITYYAKEAALWLGA
jgi:porphobilinogen synthase